MTSTPTTTARLSIPQGTALSIGAVLGTGVITLPAIAAKVDASGMLSTTTVSYKHLTLPTN